ncbi:Heparan sulfate glucosamine 3-O-sulfotransferase 3B1 [Holothuria leucospilota]|uniref:Heparan sulfate glucosamine 3-O-sulfotransferase 3B1 n=1 Tax=Holothuria leucospilota TaxID=206669 RepID=A0A9Q1CL57_HOLLE|nr:Heparan sulfate glucosamine 3-O-sulfotransferase 3B1 [Holothuria leucospilota]
MINGKRRTADQYVNGAPINLREEAINAGLIPSSYVGDIFRQGCYLYLSNGFIKQKDIPKSSAQILHCKKRLPTAFIIGVKKSGTTTLGRYVDLHENIVVAHNARLYTNRSTYTVEQSVHQYYQSMPYSTEDEITVANFPGYYWMNRPSFLQALPYMPENPKIIAILRNPVKRAISDYRHMQDTRESYSESRRHIPTFLGDDIRSTFEETVLLPNGSINATLNFIQQGMYAKHLSQFVKFIPRKRILLLSGDEFAKNPLLSLRKVEQFLGVKPFYKDDYFVYNKEKGFYCAEIPSRPDWNCMSDLKGRSHPNVSEEVLKKLEEFYKPYNLKLGAQFDLLSSNFEWIRK